MKLSHLKSKNGFSIMEVMIAAGLLGVVTVGVMQLTRNMTKGQKSQAQQLEFNQIQSQIHSLLRDEYSCESTLLGVSPTGSGTNITQVKRRKPDGTTAVVFQKGQTYGSPTNPIFLKSMAIKNFDASSGLGDFIIEMNKGRKDFDSMNQEEKDTVLATSYGTAVITRTIKLNMVLDGAGKIKDCLSDKDDYTSGTCAMIDGDWSDKVKCKSINVQGNGIEPSITAETHLHVKRGLNVGSTLSGDPGDGNATFLKNIDVRDRASVSNDATIVSGNLIFYDGDARINQELGGNLYIENKAGTAGANIIAGKTGAARTTVTPTSVTVNKNGTIGAGLALEVIGNTTLTGSGSTSVTLKVGNADILYNGTDLLLNKPGAGVVRYMDTSPHGSRATEIATQGFVNGQMAEALRGNPTQLSALMSNLSAYVAGNPLEAISASVCNTYYNNMNWEGNKCVDRRNDVCPAGQMMVGISNGGRQCITYTKTNQTCPAGQMFNGYDSNGIGICTNADNQIGNYVDAKIADAAADNAANSTCAQKGGWFDKGSGGGRGVCRYQLGCTFGYFNGCHACGGPWGSCPAGWDNWHNDYTYGGSCSWTCGSSCHNPNGRKDCWCNLSSDGKSCGGDNCGGCY